MEYGKAFTFLTEDEKWISKLLIGAVMAYLGFVILPIFILWGYSVEILENVANGSMRPLPEWNDFFGPKLRKGLNIFVIRFVYALPLIVFACCYALVQIALTSALAGGSSQGNATANPNGSLGAIVGIVGLCFSCIAIIYGILMTLAVDAATIIYVSTGQLNSAFKFREVIAFTQKHVSELFLSVLMIVLATLVGGLVSLITCGLGFPVVSAWVEYARGHLLGQIYRRAGLPPPPVIPSPMGASLTMPPMQPT
jgi:hypothetical protein